MRKNLCGVGLRAACLFGCLCLSLAAPAAADQLNITIVNPSFEALDAADLATGASSRWSTEGLATFDPQNNQFTGTTGNNVQGELIHGGQVGNLDLGRVLSQNLSVTSIAGATYNLNYFHGRRRDVGTGGSYRVELLEGATTILSQDVTASTLGFQAAPALSGIAAGGQPLTLRFTSLSGQSFLDMPTLTATADNINVIPVVNSSFALADVADVATGNPTGWITTGLATANGVFDPHGNQFPGTTGNNVLGGLAGSDGQVGNIESTNGSLTQNLGVTVTPDETVYLNVAVGNRADGANDPNYSLELLLDGVVFASATNPVTPGNGEFHVAELVGVAPSVGELGIRFSSHGGQTFLDNVNVYTVSAPAAVPEPGSLAIFAVCGGLGCIAVGLRRAAAKRKG
jgi:hypothetical protein